MLPHVSKNPSNDVYSFCRDIAITDANEEAVIFTNDKDISITLQIDESLFGKARK